MTTDVIETCAYCGEEANMIWDLEKYGYKAVCPHCGEPLFLCSACQDDCDEKGCVKCDWRSGPDGGTCFRVNRKQSFYKQIIFDTRYFDYNDLEGLIKDVNMLAEKKYNGKVEILADCTEYLSPDFYEEFE